MHAAWPPAARRILINRARAKNRLRRIDSRRNGRSAWSVRGDSSPALADCARLALCRNESPAQELTSKGLIVFPDGRRIVADLGAWSIAHPPATGFFVPTGFQYAIEPFRGGFLVTDGHHNRVLRVTRNGEITELIAFGNVAPTGLAVSGNSIYVAQAGPIPHQPADGRVVVFRPKWTTATEVAAGARLAVDVEFGRGRTLFALSQGFWDGPFEGTPALLNTGALMRVNGDGTLTTVGSGLDRPTSVEIIKNTAYVVTLTGEIWKIKGIKNDRHGDDHDDRSHDRARDDDDDRVGDRGGDRD